MMSLFSSFDFFYFYPAWLVFFMASLLMFTKSYVFTLQGVYFSVLIKELGTFFLSLKPKSFNKTSELIFILMFLILGVLNFLSVFSFNFPVFSQVSVVFFCSLSIWVSFIFFSFFFSLSKSLYHLVPEGTPLPLTFLLFLIELVSSLIRPLTLMVRLVANILAGHLLMILLCSLVMTFWMAFPLYLVLNLVEVFVALIQSYIFSTMLVLYYSEV